VKTIIIASSLLLAGFQAARAQTEPIPLTTGPCVAQFRPGVHGNREWVISVNYQPIFTEADLSLPPFVRGGDGKPTITPSFFERNPVFGCTTDTIHLAVFQADIVEVATKNFVTNSDWTIEIINQVGFGKNNAFPAPDGLVGSVNFLTVRAFLTQGNRVVMLGDFASGNRKSSRAYDLSSGKNHLFNFAGLEASSITNACVTAKALWFTVTVGNFQELFEVDSNGNLILIATVSIGGTIWFSCGPDDVELGIQAAGTLK